MRVGLVIYGSLETLSGGYLYDRELVAYLRQAGDDVQVISLPWRSYPHHLAHNLSAQLARRLCALDVDVLCEGHYGVFDGRAAVADFIERFVDG